MTYLAATSILLPIQAFAHALGWTLLHFLWQGTLIAMVLACVLALLSDRSPQPRYLASCCALLLMTLLPVVTFARLIAASRGGASAITLSLDVNGFGNGHGGAPTQPLLERIAQSLEQAMPAVLAIWSLGVALLVARLTFGLIMARRMKSSTTQLPANDLLFSFQQIASHIGVSRPIKLLQSTLVQVPTVIGWLRPVVLIPVGCLSGLSTAQVEAILAHELAHIRRHDYLVSVLQSIVEALLFYHPAVWWVSQQIRRDREHCCDDLAVHIGGNALTYARALSLLEEHRSTLPAIALGANGGTLTMRIKRLLGTGQSPAVSQLAALALFGIVLVATAVCITTAARAQANTMHSNFTPHVASAVLTEDLHGPARPGDNAKIPVMPALTQQPNGDQTMSVEYKKWIDEDVRWNITPPERTAFLQLTTDVERDHFIDQFWQRRDPAGSPRYTFRAEHYSRIAYANQHFAAGIAGWETDRGHIYIAYGPPDTVDTHPATDGNSNYETWRYSSAPGLGQNLTLKFVDTCSCGNYQLEQQTETGKRSFPDSRPQPARTVPSVASRVVAKPGIHRASYFAPTAAPERSEAAQANPARKVSGGIMAGQIIFRVDPVYPPAAKADGIEGTVVLDAVISTTGTVENLKVVSGVEQLAASALDAARQWKYKPYLLNGMPTEVETTITITYRHDDADLEVNTPQTNSTGVTPKKIGNGVSAPILTHSVMPEFSEEARRKKVSGKVLVNLWVDTEGNPSHVRVVRGIDKGLDEGAVAAVKKYKFKPAMEDGKPVLVEVNTEVNFAIF